LIRDFQKKLENFKHNIKTEFNHFPRLLKQNKGKKDTRCMFSLLKSWLSTLHTIWPFSSKTVAAHSWKGTLRDRHYRIVNKKKDTWKRVETAEL